MPPRFRPVLLIAALFAAACAHAAPGAAGFDSLFLAIDEGRVSTSSRAEALAALRRLQAALPAGDAMRARRFAAMRCVLDFWQDPPRSLAYAQARLLEARAANDSAAQARLHYCRGFRLEGLDEGAAFTAYDTGVALARRAEDQRLVADGLVYRGGVHSLRGDQALALEDLLLAQSLYARGRMHQRSESNLLSIGIAYRRLRDFPQALEYLRQTEAFARRTSNRTALFTALMQQGFAYSESRRATEAIRYFTAALEVARLTDRVDQGYARLGLADAYVVAGDGARALAEVSLARSDMAVDGSAANEPMLDQVRGQALALLGRHREAMPHFDRAEPLMRAQHNTRYLALLHEARARSAEALGDAPRALAELRRFDRMARRLRADAENQRLSLWRTRFDASRRALERERLHLERARHEAQIRALEKERRWRWIVLALGVLLGGMLAAFAITQRRHARYVRALALSDPLTGIANRRRILFLGERATAAANAQSQPLCVITLDLDHFKRVNDAHGHALGDHVLTEVAAALTAAIRRDDHLGRTGGEEFLVILPATPVADAVALAERLRQAVQDLDLHALAPGLQVRISGGVAEWRRGDSGLQALIRRADAALYRAKDGGRNRVEVAD